ncbi:hypothetical protein PsYK624_154700 [Phanerochaete sordida]|uniref:DUF6533 domain-containing protein n=1 Tax=Phanerochaete sordida TaxID=48140 RepID=A0A9P3LLB2_9APHY|nr:hypothetical protein PsYK624_154700 [Phanerochaete sordida]
MSQLSAADVYARLVNDYIAHCQVALAVYEYLVTIDQEISMVWKRKITAASVLLLASRSLMVLDPIFEVIPVSSQASCQAGLFLSDITFAFNQIVVALFSALRVYAISQQVQKKKIISGLVFGLSIIPLATNIFNWSRTTIVWQPDSGGCAVMSALSEDLNNRAAADEKQRDCHGCRRRGHDMGEFVPAFSGDATLEAALFHYGRTTPRWNTVLHSPPCYQCSTVPDFQHVEQHIKLRPALPPVHALRTRTALHAQPAAAQRARR